MGVGPQGWGVVCDFFGWDVTERSLYTLLGDGRGLTHQQASVMGEGTHGVGGPTSKSLGIGGGPYSLRSRSHCYA
jgi:hypothetical protein